jgi:hypothetical protein
MTLRNEIISLTLVFLKMLMSSDHPGLNVIHFKILVQTLAYIEYLVNGRHFLFILDIFTHL